MDNPGAVEKFLVPLQDLQEKDPLMWVVQGSRRWRGEIMGSWRGLGEECCQGGGWWMNEYFCSIPAVYISMEALCSTDRHELKEQCKCILNKI